MQRSLCDNLRKKKKVFNFWSITVLRSELQPVRQFFSVAHSQSDIIRKRQSLIHHHVHIHEEFNTAFWDRKKKKTISSIFPPFK